MSERQDDNRNMIIGLYNVALYVCELINNHYRRRRKLCLYIFSRSTTCFGHYMTTIIRRFYKKTHNCKELNLEKNVILFN
jgi:hypothetical protein